MSKALFSVAVGRPPGELRRKGNAVTWCVWLRSDPRATPYVRPDLCGGARSRDDAERMLVSHVAAFGAFELEQLPARYCQAWRKALRAALPGNEATRPHVAPSLPGVQWDERTPRVRTPTQEAAPAVVALPVPEWARALGLPSARVTRREVLRAYRAKAFLVHPDRGGTHDAFIKLSAARDRALVACEHRRM